ncbi:MAG: hypothetical protein AAFQ43_03335 [Bacteroidota bacterium]
MPRSRPSRPFSRSMPPLDSDSGPLPFELILVLVALAVTLIGLAIAFPVFAAILAARYGAAALYNNWHLARLRKGREGESICTFARAFDLRQIDPWIVRAVWDALQPYVGSKKRDFPIRPSDDITRDLCVDPEDGDELVASCAKRAGRSMEDAEQNPLFGSIWTVEDFVRFLNAQPVAGSA